jgi:hypothetical protein
MVAARPRTASIGAEINPCNFFDQNGRRSSRLQCWTGLDSMNMADASDESLLAYYESIRRQVAADLQQRSRYRLVGANVREYAERLKDEITRRQLPFKPIVWPPS